MHVLNEVRQIVDCNAVVADVRRDDVGGERQERVFGTLDVGRE
jgi:hypothetical protein